MFRSCAPAHFRLPAEQACVGPVDDGEDPDEEPHFEAVVLPQDVRKKLGMTQTDFAALLRVPIGTLRNWEQNRFVMEPAAQTLLKLIDREPEAALRALRQPHAA